MTAPARAATLNVDPLRTTQMTASRPNGFWAFLRVFGRGINMVRLVIINLVFFACC